LIDIRPAGKEDNEQLLNLLGRCPQGNTLVVRQERYGDFFARSRHYWLAETIAAWDEERIVGTLECGLHPVSLDGTEMHGGYLYGLSVDPEYRRLGIAARLLAGCESFLVDHGADFSCCTIPEDNYPSLGLLGRSGYEERSRLQQMILISVRRRKQDPRVRQMEAKDCQEVAELLNHTYRDYDLYQPFTAESLESYLKTLPGFSMTNDVYVMEEDGEITACLGCWQISNVVSGVIMQWDARLAAMTRFGHLLRKWMPLPHIPELGEAYRHCAAYPLAFRYSARDLVPLWNAVHQHIFTHGLGSLSFYATNTGREHSLREAGLMIRGGTSRVLMKSFGTMVMDRQKPIFVSPLD
jgi:ribosomal protein S18 acetylase RimI-like enzyme